MDGFAWLKAGSPVVEPGLAEAILDQAGQGYLAFDRSIRLALCNRRGREILGLGDLAPVGGPLAELLPGPIREPVLAACRKGLAARESGLPIHVALDDGRALRWRVHRIGRERWAATLDEVRQGGGADDCTLADPMTGLRNRRAFMQTLAGGVAPGTALLMLDLDRFKAVNDLLGHKAGDELLRLAGQRLAGALRDGDFVARLEGDEFAVILPRGEGAQTLGTRLLDLLSRPYVVRGSVAIVGASIGIARAPDDGEDGETLLRHANLALYNAKQDGRGLVCAFRPALAERAASRHALEADLRSALTLSQFELFFQPQTSLVSRRLQGFEALLRWNHPARGLVSPTEFIPLAEETKLIGPIGEWALRAACQTAQGWPSPVSVAVNVSAVQLAEPARLFQTVEAALRHSDLDPARLELEITESSLVRDPDSALEALRTLRALGIRIAMDDFGTGYSSLSQLRSFPFDKLKIDRSFVRDLGESAEAAAVVRAIAALGTSLGMRTTAEGVETDAQADRVRDEGCTDMQGYLVSRPVPACDLPGLFARLGT